MTTGNFEPGLSPEERLRLLEDNADKTYKGQVYQRPLTDEELAEIKEKYFQNRQQFAVHEKELDDFKAGKKLLMDPLKKDAAQMLGQIVHKTMEATDDLFELFDFEERTAAMYNSLGEFISARKLRPDEKQKGLYSLNRKTANNE